ncbi:Hypothetical predicted protein, partial [Pelobates cultripes]
STSNNHHSGERRGILETPRPAAVEIPDWYDLSETEAAQTQQQRAQGQQMESRKKPNWKTPAASPFTRSKRQPTTPRRIQ